MNWIRRNARTVGINIILFFAVVGLLLVLPITGSRVLELYIKIRTDSSVTRYLTLPNYANIEWVEQYFRDQNKIQTRYSDFVTWIPESLTTQTINIDKYGRRKSIHPDPVGTDLIWLFGGSTMWGMGVDDANTIPSHLANQMATTTINFGVNGYVSRQNIGRLLQAYTELSPDTSTHLTIVFYGGVNDALYSCQADKSPFSTISQRKIQTALENQRSVESASVKQLVQPSLVFIDNFMTLLKKSRLGRFFRISDSSGGQGDLYLCDNDPERARLAAQILVENWKTAQSIVEAHGGQFVSVLQPASAISHTRLDHIPETTEFDKQYQAVYPYIRLYAKESNLQFHDLSSVLDRDEYIYIDDCHVTPNGNEYIAQAIAEILS